MNDIIRYFYEECIRKFADLRTNLYEDPGGLAEFKFSEDGKSTQMLGRTCSKKLLLSKFQRKMSRIL